MSLAYCDLYNFGKSFHFPFPYFVLFINMYVSPWSAYYSLSIHSDIQICNVKPIPEDNPLFLEAGTDIPEKIASFYQVNDVRKFQLDRPVHKGPIDKENEFKVSTTF